MEIRKTSVPCHKRNLFAKRYRTPPEQHHVPRAKTSTWNIIARGAMAQRIPQESTYMINLLDEKSPDKIADSAGARIWKVFIRISQRGNPRSIHNCTARQIDHRHNYTRIRLTLLPRMRTPFSMLCAGKQRNVSALYGWPTDLSARRVRLWRDFKSRGSPAHREFSRKCELE
jgi:hypothetical protein